MESPSPANTEPAMLKNDDTTLDFLHAEGPQHIEPYSRRFHDGNGSIQDAVDMNV